MSRTQEINYPPEEILHTGIESRLNIEHIILWMLRNNGSVEWADFISEPVGIAQSTLSNKLKSLMRNDCVKKIQRGKYKITPKGEERYNRLSEHKKQRILSYPPKAITKVRNYNHWILWTVYNNKSCKWIDFIDEPLRINQSSLSKSLIELQDLEIIKKENKTYSITQKGKSEYSRVLKLYDLDRQSILDDESNRIKEITKKTITFFEKYKIEDAETKFRFLNNVLTLPYANLRGSLSSEEDFNKVLLFLSMNHPNQYPFYITPEDFTEKYYFDLLDLKFNVRQIIEKKIYTTKFFLLKVEEGKIYYFQANEKIEKVLSAITEDHITKFTYLNKLYENTPNGTPSLSLSHTIESILAEICDHLFHARLKDALRDFLPEYIKYLAFRIETERKLLDSPDKISAVALRNINEEFQAYRSNRDLVDQRQEKYYIDSTSIRVLKLFSDPKLEKLLKEAKHMMKKQDKEESLKEITKNIKLDPDNVNLLFLKSIVLSHSNRHQEAIRFLKNKFKAHPNRKDEELFIPYNYTLIYNHLNLMDFEKALKISERMSDYYPNNPLTYMAKSLIDGYKIAYKIDAEGEKAELVLDNIDRAIELEENKKNVAKYYHFKSFILKHLKKFDDALESIDIALNFEPKNLSMHFMKYKILHDFGKIDEILELVEEGIKLFPDHEIKLLTHKANLFKKKNKYDKGLEIIDGLWEKYPGDLDVLNSKVYYHLYLGEKEEALRAGKLLVESDPESGNFHDSYAEALTEFGEYEEALKETQKALESDPIGWFTYNTYFLMAKCYKELGQYELSRDNLDKGVQATRTCYCDIEMREEGQKKRRELLAEIQELEAKS